MSALDSEEEKTDIEDGEDIEGPQAPQIAFVQASLASYFKFILASFVEWNVRMYRGYMPSSQVMKRPRCQPSWKLDRTSLRGRGG